jgi:hypothetical protein
MQHLSRPHCPASFAGLSERPCAFTIFTDTAWNSFSHDEQQSSRPHTPTPPATRASSRAPICFTSMRVPIAVPSSRARSRSSTLSSAAMKTVVRPPSKLVSTFTSFTGSRLARTVRSAVARSSRSCWRLRSSRASSRASAFLTTRRRWRAVARRAGGITTVPSVGPCSVSTSTRSSRWRINGPGSKS